MIFDVSIIIINFRSADNVKKSLDSLKSSAKTLKIQVIIVNNSPEEDLSGLRSHSLTPEISVNNQNIGFSKAVNQGLKKAKGEYILLLNPDSKFIGKGLEKLHTFASTHPNIGAVVPRLLNSNGTPQASVFRFPSIINAIKKDFFGCKNCFGKYLPKRIIQTVDVAVMAAMLIPKSTFAQIGNLDERFFLYYEDVEFCSRIHKANLPLYYFPDSTVKHLHGASGGFTSHLNSPLLASSKVYYGNTYSRLLNLTLWVGHKWQVILRGKKFRD